MMIKENQYQKYPNLSNEMNCFRTNQSPNERLYAKYRQIIRGCPFWPKWILDSGGRYCKLQLFDFDVFNILLFEFPPYYSNFVNQLRNSIVKRRKTLRYINCSLSTMRSRYTKYSTFLNRLLVYVR